MANEVSGYQVVEFLRDTPRQIRGTFYESPENRKFWLPVSCVLAGRRTMPALSSTLTGYNTLTVQWMHFSDPWNSEPDYPHFKRLKFFFSCTHRRTTVSSKPLASHDKTSSSTCENSSSVSKISSTATEDAIIENSDRGTASTFWFGTNERKRSPDQNGTEPMPSKRERGMRGAAVDDEGWQFRVVASSRCKSPSLLASDVIGTIDFNQDGKYFATGGIARKIRICSYEKLISVHEGNTESSDEDIRHEDSSDEDHDTRKSSSRKRRDLSVRDHEYASAGEICTPGKLSSVKWRPDGSEVIGCGDYDGVVMEWNIEHGHTVSEKYEHCGQRVWSLDYSKVTPTLSASSSADGTVRVWSRGTDKSVSVLRPDSGNSICSAEFSPVADYLIAVASADTNVYMYDIRNSESPMLKLGGHDRAVSYVRFLGKDKLVSASIDSTLKLWDISAPLRDVQDEDVDADYHGRLVVKQQQRPFDHGGLTNMLQNPLRTFGAHTNIRHFVGLSIHRGAGLLACGSETNEVFLYRDSCSHPLLNVKFPGQSPVCRGTGLGSGKSYVGAVCWREHGDNYALVAANSEGIVQVLEVVR
ncbi:unnamed protein product [Calypogeia fissa]